MTSTSAAENPPKTQAPLPLRILVLLVGMAFAAFGIAAVTSAALGTTPISSVPVVLADMTGLTFGTTTILINCCFVIGQIVLLQRVSAAILMQVPAVLLFGLFIDLGMSALAPVTDVMRVSACPYAASWVMSLAGNVLLATGITMQIRSNTIVQAGEGIVLAVCYKFKKTFGSMKVANDLSLVAIAVVMELAAFGTVTEVREGTLVSAVMVGMLVKAIQKRLDARNARKTEEA